MNQKRHTAKRRTARCPVCKRVVRVRKVGVFGQHPNPNDLLWDCVGSLAVVKETSA